MTPPKHKHSPETRAAVVAALLAGQSVSAVAREYKLPKGTVSAWKTRGSQPPAFPATQKQLIGERLYTLVIENLQSLTTAAKLGQDIAWARGQGAAELATFYGVMADKTIRLLEAMSNSAQDESATSVA